MPSCQALNFAWGEHCHVPSKDSHGAVHYCIVPTFVQSASLVGYVIFIQVVSSSTTVAETTMTMPYK